MTADDTPRQRGEGGPARLSGVGVLDLPRAGMLRVDAGKAYLRGAPLSLGGSSGCARFGYPRNDSGSIARTSEISGCPRKGGPLFAPEMGHIFRISGHNFSQHPVDGPCAAG